MESIPKQKDVVGTIRCYGRVFDLSMKDGDLYVNGIEKFYKDLPLHYQRECTLPWLDGVKQKINS